MRDGAEAVLQAEKHNRERDDLRFVQALTPSTYIEVSVMDRIDIQYFYMEQRANTHASFTATIMLTMYYRD